MESDSSSQGSNGHNSTRIDPIVPKFSARITKAKPMGVQTDKSLVIVRDYSVLEGEDKNYQTINMMNRALKLVRKSVSTFIVKRIKMFILSLALKRKDTTNKSAL